MKSFLCLHAISSFGDGVLYYGLPIGLGLATGDVRSTVLMFLVPGIAIKLSTFFKKIILNSKRSSRLDYAYLLIFLGVIEVFISIPFFFDIGKVTKIFLASFFVFIYAFLKEGIPRILFSVEVYKYFCFERDYKKLVSYGHIVRMIFTLLGSLLASFLIENKVWEFSMLLDAITFVVYGGGILILGKDVKKRIMDVDSPVRSNFRESITLQNKLKFIAITIPFLSFVSCLFYPYINLLLEIYNVSKASLGVSFTALISFFIAVLNLKFGKITSVSLENYILFLTPFLFVILGVLFNLSPSIHFYIGITVVAQMYYSLFNTVDYNCRIQLPRKELVDFNTSVTRNFSVAQISSCLIALFFFSYNFKSYYLAYGIVLSFGGYMFLLFKNRRKNVETG